MDLFSITNDDCLNALRAMESDSVDAVVTDPPYGLSFMAKKWDYDVPSTDIWRECLRVLKPGGHLLAFAGTRTQHRMCVRIEDAGFEIRDMIAWIYGSGFPKSLDVSKAIDKAAGAEREVVGEMPKTGAYGDGTKNSGYDEISKLRDGVPKRGELFGKITAPATPDAIKWQGWGTAIKPSVEPITVARKPLTVQQDLLSLAEECRSRLFAAIAKRFSTSNPNASRAAVTIAQWRAVENMPTPAALSEATATLLCALATTSNLNIESLCRDILDEVSERANTFTTEMASSLIIDLKILRSCLSKSTPENTTLDATNPSGDTVLASDVENLLNVLRNKLNFIQEHSVQENATGLRPNLEPITLARKPLSESTVAKNVLKWGTGAVNVDGCRVATTDNLNGGAYSGDQRASKDGAILKIRGEISDYAQPQGRFPANLIIGCCGNEPHDEGCAARVLDEQSGVSKSPGKVTRGGSREMAFGMQRQENVACPSDSGGASRFFYVAKASKAERNAGCEGLPERDVQRHGDRAPDVGRQPQVALSERNHHPTVKPLKLMRYLCRLVTPPGGVVLDPFTGSGSTGVAALQEGFRFVGIEREAEYVEIARRRLEVKRM